MVLLPLTLLLLTMLGCQGAHVSEPVVKSLGGDEAQLDFWHELANRPVTCNDDAFHGLLLYLDQTDPSADYAARVQTLKSRHLIAEGFNCPADEAVTRGTLAVAISSALNVKGGMMMHLSPGCARYAVRELVYQDLYPPSTPNQTFSGAEFLGIIGRMEDYQRGDNTDLPASQLPQ